MKMRFLDVGNRNNVFITLTYVYDVLNKCVINLLLFRFLPWCATQDFLPLQEVLTSVVVWANSAEVYADQLLVEVAHQLYMHDWIVFRELDHPSIKLDFGIVLLKLVFNKNDIPDVACLRALDKKHIRSPHAFNKRFEGESFSSDESSVLDETTGSTRTDLCLCLCFTLASHNVLFFVSLFPQFFVRLLLISNKFFC